MKKTILFIFSFLLLITFVHADNIIYDGIEYVLDNDTNTVINVQTVDEKNYLFLPSSANLEKMDFKFDTDRLEISKLDIEKTVVVKNGESLNLKDLFDKEEELYVVELKFFDKDKLISETELNIMKSKNLNSMYIKSKSEKENRLYVDKSKKNRPKADMVYLDKDGNLIYNDELKQIKSRGNSTWRYPKKPYQIKLKEKFDLLETNIKDEANKTWIVLANYGDSTLIRNSISLDIAKYMEIPYTPNSRHIDLYYDGEYRGNYLLIEKTQIKKGRVDINNLEKDFDEANPDKKLKKEKTIIAKNKLNNTVQYVKDIKNPKDISGGYLLELDFDNRAEEEMSYFVSDSGQYVVSKEPEYLSKEAIDYISELYQKFEDSVFNGGKHPKTNKDYTEFIDLDTIVKYYLHLEFICDIDAFWSSTFFFKTKDEYKLYAAPVWDCDNTFNKSLGLENYDFLICATRSLPNKLLNIKSFREEVKNYYAEELAPIIENNILNSSNKNIKSIDEYKEMLKHSHAMDKVLWNTDDFESSVKDLKDFIYNRNEFLKVETKKWDKPIVLKRQFIDVGVDDWFYESLYYLRDKKIFLGNDKCLFMPRKNINYKSTAIVVYRLCKTLGIENEDNKIMTVDKDDFKKEITRGEFIKIIYDIDCKIEKSNLDKTPEKWAVDNGIIVGRKNGDLALESKITRAEVAKIIANYLKLREDYSQL